MMNLKWFFAGKCNDGHITVFCAEQLTLPHSYLT